MKVTTAVWLVVVALVAAAVAVFAVSNAQPVPIDFVGWRPAPSLALLVIGAFLCGGVVVAGISLPGRIRLGLRVRALERQLAATTVPGHAVADAPLGDPKAAGVMAGPEREPAPGTAAPDRGPRQLPASAGGQAGPDAAAPLPPAAGTAPRRPRRP